MSESTVFIDLCLLDGVGWERVRYRAHIMFSCFKFISLFCSESSFLRVPLYVSGSQNHGDYEVKESMPRLLDEKAQLEAARTAVMNLPPGVYELPADLQLSACRPSPGAQDVAGSSYELASIKYPELIDFGRLLRP